ncbi:MAG: hypothetical protein DDT41_01464 [candidate division WS2 bacterium]|nr:hypothetical protein [Candidatus Psychracetigena formicireducens]
MTIGGETIEREAPTPILERLRIERRRVKIELWERKLTDAQSKLKEQEQTIKRLEEEHRKGKVGWIRRQWIGTQLHFLRQRTRTKRIIQNATQRLAELKE